METTVRRMFFGILMRRLLELTGSEIKAKEEFREILEFLSRSRAE